MCHGAGGMARHVAFGARTGASLIILMVAVFFSSSIEVLFKIFPSPVLGVILFLTGAQLALGGASKQSASQAETFTLITTAAFAMWNISVALVIGLIIHQGFKRGLIKL